MKQNAQQVRSIVLTLIMAGVAGAGFAVAGTTAQNNTWIRADVDAGTNRSQMSTLQRPAAPRIRT
jgi:hypothetical protein